MSSACATEGNRFARVPPWVLDHHNGLGLNVGHGSILTLSGSHAYADVRSDGRKAPSSVDSLPPRLSHATVIPARSRRDTFAIGTLDRRRLRTIPEVHEITSRCHEISGGGARRGEAARSCLPLPELGRGETRPGTALPRLPNSPPHDGWPSRLGGERSRRIEWRGCRDVSIDGAKLRSAACAADVATAFPGLENRLRRETSSALTAFPRKRVRPRAAGFECQLRQD